MVSTISNDKSTTLGLMSAFDATPETPVKSSLSERRQSVSYKFFEEIFTEDVKNFSDQLPTWRGLYVTATDGDNYSLPLTEGTLDLGYRGNSVKGNRAVSYTHLTLPTTVSV